MKNYVLLMMFLIFFGLRGTGMAGETADQPDAPEKAQQYAQKIIDACWKISEEDRDSGVTARMQEGTVKTINCLHNQIVDLSNNFIKSNHRDEFKKELENNLASSYKLYYLSTNAHNGCDPCGSMYHVVYLAQTASTLEALFKAMVYEAYSFGLLHD